jgi:PDZ domain-containing secreted protein
VYIDSVGKESAGAAAGLKSGDVITGVEGSKVGTTSRLQEIISTKRPGDKVKLEVKRGNQTLNLTATLKTAEGKTELASAEERNAFTKLGITLTDATDGEKKRWKINGGAKITKINSGQFRNQQPTVKESFIITRIDKKDVKTAKEAEKLIKESAGVILIEGIYAGNGQEEYFALSLN